MIFSQQNLTQTKNKHRVHYCTVLKKWFVVPSLVRAILRNSCPKKYMQAIIKNRLSNQKSWLWNSLMDHTKLSKNANIIKVKRGTSFIRPSLLQDHGIKIKTYFSRTAVFSYWIVVWPFLLCCLSWLYWKPSFFIDIFLSQYSHSWKQSEINSLLSPLHLLVLSNPV